MLRKERNPFVLQHQSEKGKKQKNYQIKKNPTKTLISPTLYYSEHLNIVTIKVNNNKTTVTKKK